MSTQAEIKMRSAYKDFSNVLTQQNLIELAKTYPETIATIDKSTDTAYNRMASLYHAVKLSKFSKDHQKKSDEMEQDLHRVKSVSSIKGSSNLSQDPLIRGRRLSPETRNRLLQEMEEHTPVI